MPGDGRGGTRKRDYQFCRLRDTTFSLPGVAEARAHFKRLLALRNDRGCSQIEYDAKHGRPGVCFAGLFTHSADQRRSGARAGYIDTAAPGTRSHESHPRIESRHTPAVSPEYEFHLQVHIRLTSQDRITRILNGGQNMPGFGGMLHPDQVSGLIA